MKKYRLKLGGTLVEKILFSIGFTVACLSLVFLPLGIIALIQNIEIEEF